MRYVMPVLVLAAVVVLLVLMFRPGGGSVFDARAQAASAATAEARAEGLLQGAVWSALMEVAGDDAAAG